MDQEDLALLEEFRRDAVECLDRAEAVLIADHLPDRAGVDQVFRAIHTVKGNAGFFSLDGVVSLAHALEQSLDAVRSGDRIFDMALVDEALTAIDLLRKRIDGGKPGATPPDEALSVPQPPVLATQARLVTAAAGVAGEDQTIELPVLNTLFAEWLVANGLVTEAQLGRVVGIIADRTPCDRRLLGDVVGLPPSGCLRVLEHASRWRMPILETGVAMGLTHGCDVELLEFCRETQRPTLVSVMAELGIGTPRDILNWMRAYSGEHQAE